MDKIQIILFLLHHTPYSKNFSFAYIRIIWMKKFLFSCHIKRMQMQLSWLKVYPDRYDLSKYSITDQVSQYWILIPIYHSSRSICLPHLGLEFESWSHGCHIVLSFVRSNDGAHWMLLHKYTHTHISHWPKISVLVQKYFLKFFRKTKSFYWMIQTEARQCLYIL